MARNQTNKLDETEYLLSSAANRKALNESIAQINAGKGIIVSLKNLWNVKKNG